MGNTKASRSRIVAGMEFKLREIICFMEMNMEHETLSNPKLFSQESTKKPKLMIRWGTERLAIYHTSTHPHNLCQRIARMSMKALIPAIRIPGLLLQKAVPMKLKNKLA